MTIPHVIFFEGGKMSSKSLAILIFVHVFLLSDLLSKITKMARLLLADKIKIRKFLKENRNLKTSKLIIVIKHVPNIEIGPQTLRRLLLKT